MKLRVVGSALSASGTPLPKYPLAIAAAVAALGIAALVNRSLAKKAERENPPAGRFVNVNGVRLHYVDRGSGEPIVLLHGNGSMIQDFASSGLIEMAAQKHRVIAFDRPGFGHSARPRGTIWTPEAQADLIHGALKQIGITRAKVLGHSWGASVAVALALETPRDCCGLDFGIGILLPDTTSRCPALVGTGCSGRWRHSQSYRVADPRQAPLAACYAQDLRAGEGAGQVSGLSERDGSSPITDPRECCRDGSDGPKRLCPARKIHKPDDAGCHYRR